MLEARIHNGKEIIPGSEVTVTTLPLRRWGTKLVTDTKAKPIKAKGVVMSVTFEKGESSIEWAFVALVDVPVFLKDGTLALCAQRFLDLKPESCIDVLPDDDKNGGVNHG